MTNNTNRLPVVGDTLRWVHSPLSYSFKEEGDVVVKVKFYHPPHDKTDCYVYFDESEYAWTYTLDGPNNFEIITPVKPQVGDMLLCGFNAGLVTGSNKFLSGLQLGYNLAIDADGNIISVDV